MNYTLINLTETEDRAPAGGMGDIQEAHFPREQLGCQATGIAYQVLRPGRRQGFAHRHSKAEEVYVVIAGSGDALLDGQVVALRPKDALRVAPETVRSFQAGPEGLELLVFGPHHDADGEMLPGDHWPAQAP